MTTISEKDNMEKKHECCVNGIEEYIGNIDLEEGKSSDPSLQLVSAQCIGFEKKIHNIIVHYAGLLKPYRDWAFRQNEILDAYFETIVSDPIGDTDPILKKFLENIQEKYDIILPQNFENREQLVEEVYKRIIDLSNEVYAFFGRNSTLEEFHKIDSACSERIEALKKERNSNLIYLGNLKGCGLCRHRSILFKVVCDMSGIPCRILRGEVQPLPTHNASPHVWNEVRIVQSVSHSTHYVDTMNFENGFVTEQYLSKFTSHDERTKSCAPNARTTKMIEQDYPKNRSTDAIGSGTFGVVYEIQNSDYVNPNDNRIEKMDFAVKVFNITEKSTIISNIEKCIKKEIETLHLLRHPNIIEIIGSFESESERKERLINIVMKKYPYHGKDFLKNLDLNDNEDMEEKRVCVLQYFMEICKGLDFIHSNGKIHYDIKPGNILVKLDEDCKRIIDVRIADFGSVKEQEFNLSLTTSPQTSARYEAPEITDLLYLRKTKNENDPELIKAERTPFTPMSDIYSFGILMKEFSTFYEGFPKMEKMIERCQLKNPIERPRINEIKYCIRSTLEVIRQKLYERYLKLDPFQPSRFSLLNKKLGISKERDEMIKKNHILEIENKDLKREQDEMKKKNHILEIEKKNLKRKQDELKKKYEIEKNEFQGKQEQHEKDLRIIRVEKTNLEKKIEVSKNWKCFFFLLIVVLFVSLLFFAISYKTISNDLRTEKELQRITESKNQEFKKTIFTIQNSKKILEKEKELYLSEKKELEQTIHKIKKQHKEELKLNVVEIKELKKNTQSIKKQLVDLEEKEKLERFSILSIYQYSELERVSDFDTSWTLLYRGSRDGFSSKSFHSKCDNIKETLVIIRTDNNYVFGGFNPLKWNLKNGYHKAEGTWIFGFENNHKKIIKMNYNHNHKNAKGGIYCSSLSGPIFGRSAIWIVNNCNLKKTSNTQIIDGWGFDKGERSYYFLNGGEQYFKVLDYEVFTRQK